MTKKSHNIARLADAEDTLEACAAAINLIPIWALKKKLQWIPSDEAINLLVEAKDSLNKYSRKHSVDGNNH